MQPINITVDHVSTQVNRIELFNDKTHLGSATGFLTMKGNDHYLVTNWHVLSGRKPFDGQPISKGLLTPNRLVLYHLTKNLQQGWEFGVQLYDKNDKSLWVQHPNGQKYDVAAIKIFPYDEDLGARPISVDSAKVDMATPIGTEVFIIGYPFGISHSGAFPLWKTGHIASEPQLPYNDLPAFLIDATTRSGMSGSPVIARKSSYQSLSGEMRIEGRAIDKFMGIYSGRIDRTTGEDSKLSTELGFVWHPKVILEMLNNGMPGSYKL